MNPLHSKATHWIRQGLFDDLKSFADFEARIDVVVEEKDRGDIFEVFIEGYLATQSITQRVKHWIVGNIPLDMRERYNLPANATGIDGIYETHDGTQVAYQVKYRRNHNLTFAEVAPFLGITEKFQERDRIIFTNATTLSDMAAARTRWFSGHMFNELSEPQLKQIEAWLKEKPVPIVRAIPDPTYQIQALADIDATFSKSDRATVVMACGTGKTLLALWAAEQAKPKTVLVLLPSLTLLQQTLKEWSEQNSWGSKFSYLCVCSDKTVGLKNDDLNIDTSEVGFRVDTDPTIVRQFLERKTDDIKVIFSTYHSTEVVAEGLKGLAPFDLGIFDEAHKTTGLSGGAFSYALSNDKVSINKRLFLTATPRHIDIRKRDRDGEFRVQSMDDEIIYGPRAHTLTFGAAANKGIICRYKVIISLIDKKMVDDFTRNNGITLVEGDEIGARWVANLIALDQAVKKVEAKKIITFHSRVALAQEFAKNEPRGIAYHLKGYDVRHVNGSQNSAERSQLISAFASSDRGLITNARCLTEGVNIPAVDMVAFIDPRQSKVDITQAVGRAMRKPRGAATKTVGYVLVPLFAGMDGESLDDAIKTEKFDAIADVLNALQEHDEELVDMLRELKQRKGEGEAFNPKRLLEKVEFIGPVVGYDELVQSISVAISDRLGTGWDEWYGRLLKYKDLKGDCKVPARHTTEGAYGLGQWVSVQRRTQAQLSEDRRSRLNELGFVWDALTDLWEAGFRALLVFYERENHFRVDRNYIDDSGYHLGAWVLARQQSKERQNPDRKLKLDKIGFEWSLPLPDRWENGFTALLEYMTLNKQCDVGVKYIDDDGFKLGSWVSYQRLHKNELDAERIQRLDALNFSWGKSKLDSWESGYISLLRYFDCHKNCLVSTDFIDSEGYKLGNWVGRQRTRLAELTIERRQRLDDIGFVWNKYESDWEDGFALLKKFNDLENHCRVPARYSENGFNLGIWVSSQRGRSNQLSENQKRRLDELGFEWRLRSKRKPTNS